MSILSLSTENKDKLLQLIESLQEVFERKDILTSKAEPFVKRMNEIETEKSNLDKKSEKYDATNFKSTIDATDLSNIILKSKQLDEEIETINASSRSLNLEFDEIIKQENEIISKIKELVSSANKSNEQDNEGILVEKLGISVFVFKPEVPDVLSIVDRGADEIINCEADIVKSLSEIYFENSKEIIRKVDRDDFKELEKYFLASKAQKEKSIDERLTFIQKTEEESKIEEESKLEIVSETINIEIQKQPEVSKKVSEPIKFDIPSTINTVEDGKIKKEDEELDKSTNDEENAMLEENKRDILSLDSILKGNQTSEQELETKEDSNVIIISDRFDNSHSKVANSNKDKLQNIINNFKGTFVLPIIKSEIVPTVETKPIDPISSFINSQTA